MTRLSFLLTVLVICVVSAQGRQREHQHSNTNINSNRWTRRSLNTNINSNRFARPGLGRVIKYVDDKDISTAEETDGPVIMSHRELEPKPLKMIGSTRPGGMAGTTAYEYNVHPSLLRPENYHMLITTLKNNFLIPQSIRDALNLDADIPHGDNGNLNINSNRFGSPIGPVGYDVVVPEVGVQGSHRRNFVDTVNAARLRHLRSQGNTNINSNQFGVVPPPPVTLRKISEDYGVLYDPDY